MSALSGKRILVVEDEFITASLLSGYFEDLKCDVVAIAATKEEAIDFTDRFQPELIAMDIKLGNESGIETARAITKRFDIPVVYTTSYSTENIVDEAMTTSPYGYIVKPYSLETVKTVCETALTRFELEQRAKKAESRYRLAAEITNLAVLEYDPNDCVFEVDGPEQLLETLKASEPLDEASFYNIFPQDDWEEIKSAVKAHKRFSRRIKLDRNGNSPLFLDVQFDDVSIQDGKVYIGAVTDVTQQESLTNELKLSDTILKTMNDGVVVLDEQQQILRINSAFSRLTGIEEKTLIGKTLADLMVGDRLSDALALDVADSYRRREVRVKCKDKAPLCCILSVNSMAGVSSLGHTVAIFTDITELKVTERKLASLAFKDSLTCCGNRNFMNYYLDTEVVANGNTTLVFIDLDGFKLVNDTYGHDVGDEILIECANRIQSTVRKTDKVIRLGGDEFVVINFEPNCDIHALGDKLLACFQPAFSTSAAVLNLHASIGIATSNKENCSFAELLKRADIAMFEAKQQGKDRVVHYDKAQSDAIEYRLFVEQGLREALNEHYLEMHYQPILSPVGEVLALESLCRWFTPTHGSVPPAKFIPIAEESRLIHSLGLYVFKECCIAKCLLRDKGLKDIKVHVNVSALQLQRPTFRQSLEDYLQGFKLSANDFVLEVTETTLQSSQSRKMLKDLVFDGFDIAVDDFGVGFSNLSELKSKINNRVKFDQTLIPVADDAEQRIVTGAMVQACHGLQKKIIMEGIETRQQHEYALTENAYGVQGYYYAKPMHLFDALNFILQGKAQLA